MLMMIGVLSFHFHSRASFSFYRCRRGGGIEHERSAGTHAPSSTRSPSRYWNHLWTNSANRELVKPDQATEKHRSPSEAWQHISMTAHSAWYRRHLSPQVRNTGAANVCYPVVVHYKHPNTRSIISKKTSRSTLTSRSPNPIKTVLFSSGFLVTMALAIRVAYSCPIVSRSDADPPSSVLGERCAIGSKLSSSVPDGRYCSAKLGLGASSGTWIWRTA